MKKKVLIISSAIIAIIILVIISTIIWYNSSLKSVDKQEKANKVTIEIKSGTSTSAIISKLKNNKLIRSELATKIYVKYNDIRNLQAGTYDLNSNMTTQEIIKNITSGNVVNNEVNITFLEGKNMRWIASKIEEETNNSKEDVYNLLKDEEYIDSLIEKYWFIEKDIKNEDIYYPLEGYLYPDTYTFESKDVTVKGIFEQLLNQTDKVLSEYKEKLEKYSIHRVLTIASLVELEGKNAEDRKGIASVIYNRISKKMSIGSDVTTYYGIKVDMGERDLYSSEIDEYNPYNTRGPNMSGKLPVGPISSVSKSSIEAALNPGKTNYLYFVADASGKIYFAKDYEGHQKNIRDLKSRGLWYNYE